LNKDISGMLSEWEYDPAAVIARVITSETGKKFIQLRLDLGIFQMHLDGRPDGSRPRGYTSILQYYQTQQSTSRGIFGLNGDDCSELQQEAQQYYYRYLAEFKLDDFDAVIRDTNHNLEMFDFVSKYAESEDMAWEFLQYKPYVLMMQARAKAELASKGDAFDQACLAIMDGLELIWAFWDNQGEPEMKVDSYEVEVLTNLLEKYLNNKPHTRIDDLREELDYAVSVENFEKAAELRDQLKALQAQLV